MMTVKILFITLFKLPTDGSIDIKILRRNAEFTKLELDPKSLMNSKGNLSLAIPKKSNIFIEQTIREKDNACQIHNIFQADLWRMRLTAAQYTLEILKTGDSNFSSGSMTSIKLNTLVYGVGPEFLVTLTLENMSTMNIVPNLSVLFHAHPDLYKIDKIFSLLSPLIPGELDSV